MGSSQSALQNICKKSQYSDTFRYPYEPSLQVSYVITVRNYFILDPIDNIIIQVFLAFSLLCALFNIFFFCKVLSILYFIMQLPSARQPPYDILFFLSILSIAVCCVYISTLVYNDLYPVLDLHTKLPSSFSPFCLVTGTISFFAQICSASYNLIFCFYYAFKIKNPLRSWKKEHKEVHLLCLIIAIIATIVVYVAQEIGVSVLGVCGLKVSKVSFFVEISISFMYLLILVLSSVLFLKYLKKLAKLDPKAKIFFKYFLIYTILISISYFLETVALAVLTIDCFTGIPQLINQIFVKIGNSLALGIPIIVTIVLVFHPQFKKSLIPSLKKNLKKTKNTILLDKGRQYRQSSMFQSQQQSDINSRSNPMRSSFFYDDLITEYSYSNDGKNSIYGRKSSFKQDVNADKLNSLQKDYLSDIKQVNKISLLATILGYLSMEEGQNSNYDILPNRSTIDKLFVNMKIEEQQDIQEQDMGKQMKKSARITRNMINRISHPFNQVQLQPIKNKDYEEQEQQQIVGTWNFYDSTQTTITQRMAEQNCEYFTSQVPTLPMKLICHCPMIFANLRKLDHKHKSNSRSNVSKSMNAFKNLQKIYKNTQADGGRSGQFFYFTYDNNFILKTITKKQLSVLKERMEPYYNHFKFNSQSLIVKLYGVYTSINSETQEQVNFMVMANLQENISKDCILRVYDLKGSTHQREVLKGIEINSQQEENEEMEEQKNNDNLLTISIKPPKQTKSTSNTTQIGVKENQETIGKKQYKIFRSKNDTRIDNLQKTLKDIDFDKLQNKIWLHQQDCKKVKTILKNDSQFFASNGLIDYSLIMIKVDYCRYLQNEKKQKQRRRMNERLRVSGYAQQEDQFHNFKSEQGLLNKRTMFYSSKQPEIVYILGIIDYLETWNMRKKGQKWYKSLFTSSQTISSQSPEYYSERFCNNLVDRIFTSSPLSETHKNKID